MNRTTIMNRLAALESRRAPPVDDGALERVMAQLDLIAGRRREQPGWKPCGVPVAALIEAARASKASRPATSSY
jgi:hypothetical protein